MRSTNIIKAEISDSMEIAKLIKDGWNAAYNGIISDEYLKNMNIEDLSENWKNKIQTNNNVYIYKEEKKILGVIIFGESEDKSINDTGEIFVLYVKVEEKRKGIGTQLLNFAKNQLIKEGYTKMIIWCLMGNKEGSNFYKKCGGIKLKERDYILGGIEIREKGFLYDITTERRNNNVE